VEIWLERVQRGDNPAIWLFSQQTLRLVPEIYQDLGNSVELDQYLPGWLKVTFLSLPLWRFGVVLIAAVLILLLEPLVIRMLRLLLAMLAERTSRVVTGEQAQDFAAPLRLILFGILFAVNASYCSTLLGRNFWRNSGNVLIVAGAAWAVMRIVGIGSNLALARLQRRQSWDKIALAGLLGRLAQISIFIIGVMAVLYLGGVNLTAALTGLGIGGIAVALAAQKTLENLFGGITIISDRPVRIGDFCKIGDVSGTVVDIGLRSTRLRTQERTIVTIANGQLAAMNLENYTMRDKFWLHPTLALSHQTAAAQMQTVLGRIRTLLDQHPSVESATARAQFIGISSASQMVEIFAYVFAANYDEFLRIQEALLLQMLDIVESAGTALALPTQVTRLVQDSDSIAPRPADHASPRDLTAGDQLQLRR
jgi:MscS family membrane protein